MIDIRRTARKLGYFLAYIYATVGVFYIGTFVVVGYAIGGAAHDEGWSPAMLDARAAMVTETIVETLAADLLGSAFLAIMSPVFALLDNLFVGAARLGYLTHSEAIALLLALSLLAAVGGFAAVKVDAVFGGETDG